MVKTAEVLSKNESNVKKVLIGSIISIMITLIGLIIFSVQSYKQSLKQNN